jgi:hypothetical protein
MPDKENTLTPEQIAEERKAAQERAIKEVTLNANNAPDSLTQSAIIRQNLSDDQKDPLKVENAIHNAYADGIQKTTDLVNTLTQKKKDAQLQDATAQRKARSMQMVAGISDGLANLANLIGVGGIGNVGGMGNNIDLGGGALTPLQQRIEAARLERKADIKSIDDRLDQANTQLLNMKLARGGALATAVQKDIEAKRAAEAAAAKRAENLNLKLLDIQAKGALQEDQQEHDATMKANENATRVSIANAKLAAEQKKIQQRQADAAADDEKNTKHLFLNYEDGSQKHYTMTKQMYEGIRDNIKTYMEKDVPMTTVTTGRGRRQVTETQIDTSTPLGKAYQDYLTALGKYKKDSTEIEQALDQVISLSPSMRAEIEKYGSLNTGSNKDDDDDEFADARVN